MVACGPTDVVIQAGDGVTISGSGTPANPYVITSILGLAPQFTTADTSSVQLSLHGLGTIDEPYVLMADVGGGTNLANLGDVDSPAAPAAGQVPVWVGGPGGHFEFQPNGVWYCTAATHPAAALRYLGLRIHETDTHKDFEWDGTDFVDKTPIGLGTGSTIPTSSLLGRVSDDNLPRRLMTTGYPLNAEDLNGVRYSGFFTGTNVTHAPDAGKWFFLISGDNADNASQTAFSPSTGAVKRRYYNGTIWSAWGPFDPAMASVQPEAAGHVTTTTMTSSGGRFSQTIHVTFPTGRFTVRPEAITFGVEGTSAVPTDVLANNVTATGFDLVFWRDTALSGVRINWIARAGG